MSYPLRHNHSLRKLAKLSRTNAMLLENLFQLGTFSDPLDTSHPGNQRVQHIIDCMHGNEGRIRQTLLHLQMEESSTPP